MTNMFQALLWALGISNERNSSTNSSFHGANVPVWWNITNIPIHTRHGCQLVSGSKKNETRKEGRGKGVRNAFETRESFTKKMVFEQRPGRVRNEYRGYCKEYRKWKKKRKSPGRRQPRALWRAARLWLAKNRVDGGETKGMREDTRGLAGAGWSLTEKGFLILPNGKLPASMEQFWEE